MIKRKILHVVNVPFVIPYFFGDQISFFEQNGFEIHIACTEDPKVKYFQSRWNFIFFNVNIGRDFSFISDLRNLIRLTSYIAREDFDFVVGHTPKGAFLASVASFLAGSKRRIHFKHGNVFETANGFKKYILFYVDRITSILATEVVCVSKSVYELSLNNKFCSNTKFRLFNRGSCNGIDVHGRFDRNNLKDCEFLKNVMPLIEHSNFFIVGFVGRLAKDKGIEILVEAWQELKGIYSDLILVICGPVDLRDPISLCTLEMIKHDPTIYYFAEVDNVECFYAKFNLLVLPSFREGLPTVVLEASSMELPVITSKSTGCIDSILENETGIFCELESGSLISTITFYYHNRAIAVEHGKNGRRFVENNFDQFKIWKVFLEELYV